MIAAKSFTERLETRAFFNQPVEDSKGYDLTCAQCQKIPIGYNVCVWRVPHTVSNSRKIADSLETAKAGFNR